MEINKPQELKQYKKTIELLSNLDFITLEKLHDEKGNYDEYIVKKEMPEITLWDKLSKSLDRDWIGQIIKDKSNGKYYFCDESGTLKSVFKLNNWEQIKQVMEIIK